MTRKLFAFLLSICLLLSLPALSACTGPAVPPQAESAIASVAPSVTDGLPQPDTSISEISAADSTSEPGTAPATTAVPTTQHSTAARPTTTAQPSLSVVDAIKAQNTSTLSGTDKQVADEAISIIKSMIPSGMSVFDKAKTIHDYMDYHFCYDIDNYNAGTIPDRDYTIAGVLLYGTGVCEGFAETYQLFMNVFGINCQIVTGVAGGGSHAWNIIELGSVWYQVDVTWDDPSNFGKEDWDYRYDYFLISDAQMAADHQWTHSDYPACSNSYDFDRGKIVILNGTVKINDKQFTYTRTYPITSVIMPDSVQEIGEWAFYYCSDLTTVQFGNGLKKVDHYAFLYCGKIVSLSLPNSLTYIGVDAFCDLVKITSVIIPSSVTSIDGCAFMGCASLAAVKFEGDAPTTFSNGYPGVFYGCAYNFTVYYHAVASGWSGAIWYGYRAATW